MHFYYFEKGGTKEKRKEQTVSCPIANIDSSYVNHKHDSPTNDTQKLYKANIANLKDAATPS
jgi:hypothetical protein